MTASPQDVRVKLDQVAAALAKTSSSYPAMVKKYGADWTKWPTGTQWYIALSTLAAARAEVGNLIAPTLTANFTERQ